MYHFKYVWIVVFIFIITKAGISQGNRIPYNDQELFLSGCNLAWLSYANDIGPGQINYNSFADIMLEMHDHGGNAMRWWLHTNGTATPAFGAADSVIGPGEGSIEDLKTILDLAWEREIGLILCLWSFGMLSKSNSAEVINRNTLLLTDSLYMDAYIHNSLIPMVDSLKGHPGIIAWEIFNEPEGMSDEFGWADINHVPMSDIQTFVNRCAGAIHRIDPEALVTNGTWSFRALSDITFSKTALVSSELSMLGSNEKSDMERRFKDRYGMELTLEEIGEHYDRLLQASNKNYYSDDSLIAAGGDTAGTLDFYSVHYYDWGGTALSPFHHSASSWELEKPIVVAEFDIKDTFGIPEENLFPILYVSGYAGALPWSWTDPEFSTHQQMLTAMQYMWDNYQQSVDIDGIGGDWPLVTLTSPDSDSVFGEDPVIDIEADASDNDGYISLVEFFASDTLKIGEDAEEPYQVTWSGMAAGLYTLTAVATDDAGHQRVSNRVSITIGVPQFKRHEAERASRTGSATVMGDPTASGGVFVRYQQEGTLTWVFSGVPKDSTYEMIIGYRLPYDRPKNQFLNINGERFTEVGFDTTLNTWYEKKINVDLLEGSNTIQFEMSWGWMDFDYIALPNMFVDVTSIDDTKNIPLIYNLGKNYPNPFNPTTKINYQLPVTNYVDLSIYNILGQKVVTLISEKQNPGYYQVQWDASAFSSGVYYYQLNAGTFQEVKKMVLIK